MYTILPNLSNKNEWRHIYYKEWLERQNPISFVRTFFSLPEYPCLYVAKRNSARSDLTDRHGDRQEKYQWNC